MEMINFGQQNFSLTDFIYSLSLMLVFLSFVMEGIRFFITDVQEMILPASTVNETVNVLHYKIPKLLQKLLLACAVCFSILVVRGMLSLPVTFVFNTPGYRAMFEMGIALGFLATGYSIAGPMIAKGITLRLLKKYKFSGLDVITDEEYMKLGKNTQC